MVGDPDARAPEIPVQQIGKMSVPRAIGAQRQFQHLVKIAVVHVAPPVHRNQAAAHDPRQILLPVRGFEQAHVGRELPLGDELAAEALNRHVGQREQACEAHIVARRQLLLVGGLQLGLIGR